MELDEFLDAIDEKRVSLADLEAMKLSKPRELFPKGPPCLKHIFAHGPQSEPRNKLLFHVCKYAKLSNPDHWQQQAEEYNRTLFNPPLNSSEVSNTIRQHEKKDYGYTCKEEPFKSYCDPVVCAQQEHGIGSDAPDAPQVGGLSIMLSEPRLYFMDVNGQRLQLSTEQLQNQTLWQRACMEQKNFMPPTMKPQKWQQTINALMQGATYLDVPEELTVAGEFKQHMRTYCTSHIRALAPEEMEMGKPWTDGGITKFTLHGLIEFLHQRRFTGHTRAQIIQMIRDLGGDNTTQQIKKRTPKGEMYSTIRCWWIPAFDEEDITLDKQEFENDIPF
jgi:hypothetical protein